MPSQQLNTFAAAPDDLQRIVLDYLCSKCYVSTAKAFARESFPIELDPDGDEILSSTDDYVLDDEILRIVELRREIKTRILAGQISEAITLLNNSFPSVLSPSSSPPPSTPMTPYEPAHLTLNLRIQHFIEQARTILLPWPSDLMQRFGLVTRQSSPAISTQPLPSVPDDPKEQERKCRLLNLFNEINMLAHALSNANHRTIYLNELEGVGGLLVYPVPERSKELRKFLDMRRREAIAEQINDAILFRTNNMVPPIIELAAQQTDLLYSTLYSLGKPIPPPDDRPPEFDALLRVIRPSTLEGIKEKDTNNTKGTRDGDGIERDVIPRFELEDLLRADF